MIDSCKSVHYKCIANNEIQHIFNRVEVSLHVAVLL